MVWQMQDCSTQKAGWLSDKEPQWPLYLRDLIGNELIAADCSIEGSGGEEVRHDAGLAGRDGSERCTRR